MQVGATIGGSYEPEDTDDFRGNLAQLKLGNIILMRDNRTNRDVYNLLRFRGIGEARTIKGGVPK